MFYYAEIIIFVSLSAYFQCTYLRNRAGTGTAYTRFLQIVDRLFERQFQKEVNLNGKSSKGRRKISLAACPEIMALFEKVLTTSKETVIDLDVRGFMSRCFKHSTRRAQRLNLRKSTEHVRRSINDDIEDVDDEECEDEEISGEESEEISGEESENIGGDKFEENVNMGFGTSPLTVQGIDGSLYDGSIDGQNSNEWEVDSNDNSERDQLIEEYLLEEPEIIADLEKEMDESEEIPLPKRKFENIRKKNKIIYFPESVCFYLSCRHGTATYEEASIELRRQEERKTH